MELNYSYLFLLAPLHTGGTTQEGNLLGIAREVHTELPYIPSSTIRGRLRASIDDQSTRDTLFGSSLNDGNGTLTQGDIWIGDGSLLWIPVSSLSHGVLWVSSPLLLRRWAKFQSSKQNGKNLSVPADYSTSLDAKKPVYLKDAILKPGVLQAWSDWRSFIPAGEATGDIDRVLVLPDRHFKTLVQMALSRQVKIQLKEETKTVKGGFRYEEAIPRDTLMYFPWGLTSQASAKSNSNTSEQVFRDLLSEWDVLQIGGQESLGRGFVQQWCS